MRTFLKLPSVRSAVLPLLLAPTAAAFMSSAAFAQSESDIGPAPPIASVQDEVGVNLSTRLVSLSLSDLSIGPKERPLGHSIYFSASRVMSHAIADDYVGGIQYDSACEFGAMVGIGPNVECFSYTITNGVYYFTAEKSLGSTLVDIGGDKLRYTTRDGVKYIIDLTKEHKYRAITTDGVITEIQEPNGLITKINWEAGGGWASPLIYRISSVTRNDNYELRYFYISDSPYGYDWLRPSEIRSYNKAYSFYGPTAQFSQVFNMSTGERSLTVTDAGGGVTKYNMDLDLRVIGIKPPTSSAYEITYDHCPTGGLSYCTIPHREGGPATIVTDGVRGATREGRSISYSPTLNGDYLLTVSSTDSDGTITVNSEIEYYSLYESVTRILDVTEKNGTKAYFNNNATNLMSSQTIEMPASTSYAYNSRGGIVTQTRGGSLQRSADYPAGCTNTPTCNKPTSITDENDNEVTYAYHSTSGYPTKITWPAVNGITPQVRYAYTQMTATGQSSGIWVLTQESRCRQGVPHTSGAGCADPADEVTKTYEYSPGNLLVKGIVETANGVSRRTCFAYDKVGNKISETAPKGTGATCP